MKSDAHPNSLIKETSPYLLQHAYNPVNWYAWNDEALNKAKHENKLILISVGYSACHWCHVMEHESFEDENVAKLMNDHFVCIKVDREERPDIDQIYMMAVQLMTGHGGWPLNCFALPDGRPIYGGTYFPKQQWMNILLNLTDTYNNDPDKVLNYAKQLTEGVRLAELVKVNTDEKKITIDLLHECYQNWKPRFDNIEGGANKAPKFPLPNNYQFLLHYYYHTKDAEVLKHIELTLHKMAFGGIYDQIGGGFARYSVDHYWKAPHFEKMLYDNAQLVSLYCGAFQLTKNPLYKQIVFETLEFIEREMISPEGGFYSALDADSEGIEGKFYVWKKEELQNILKEKFDLTADYFNVNEHGLWEHGNYILLRHDDDKIIAAKHNMDIDTLQKAIVEIKKELLKIREERVRPGIDNKILTSWNALMSKAYIEAYMVFDEQHFLDVALKNINLVLKYATSEPDKLFHLIQTNTSFSENTKTKFGFLEDYAFTIEALISLYESTFDEKYLINANKLMVSVIEHFQDKTSGMFYFTSDEGETLITRKMELSDNVIPASNSSIAKSLFILGRHFENEDYIVISRKMLNNMLSEIINYGPGYSNWAILALYFVQPFYEIAIVGKSVDEKHKAFQKHYLPNRIFAGSAVESSLPLLKNKIVTEQTLIYVCSNKTCNEPVNDIDDALKQLTY